MSARPPRLAQLTSLSFLPDPHKPYEEAPVQVPDRDLDPLHLLYTALCVSGSPPGLPTAEQAVALLAEIDAVLDGGAPPDVAELLADLKADHGPDEDDEEEDDDDDEDDDDNEDDDDPNEEDDAERMDFAETTADLLRHGGNVEKVVGQAKDILGSFATIFLDDDEA